MVEGHAAEASEEEMLQAIEIAKKPISEICALINQAPRARRQAQAPPRPLEGQARARGRDPRLRPGPAREGPLHQGEDGALRRRPGRHRRGQGQVRRPPRRRDSRAGSSAPCMEDMQYHILRSGILDKSLRVDGRGLEDIQAHHLRDRHPRPRPRLGPLHPRRDPVPRHHYPRHRSSTSRSSTTSRATAATASCCTTTSRPTRSARSRQARHGSSRDRPRATSPERAIEEVLPSKEKFPYTIRVV